MTQKVYRNIFFKKNILIQGKGTTDVYYSGHVYSNAESMKDFKTMYDAQKDLFIPCTDCAYHKYGKFIKKN